MSSINCFLCDLQLSYNDNMASWHACTKTLKFIFEDVNFSKYTVFAVKDNHVNFKVNVTK